MKHLRLFKTEAEYNTATLELPNVSYIEETKGISYEPKSNPSLDYIMVDLSLPSGLLWADRNVGASSPEDTGLYFAWGDTVGYTPEQVANGEKVFDWSDYFDTTDDGSAKFNKYAANKLTVLESVDDAAAVNMGLEYRIPSKSDFIELINNTIVTYIDIYGNEHDPLIVYGMLAPGEFKGVKFTGSNGNSIFIPTEDLYSEYYEIALWCNSIYLSESSGRVATMQTFDINGEMLMGNGSERYMGICVRGVK